MNVCINKKCQIHVSFDADSKHSVLAKCLGCRYFRVPYYYMRPQICQQATHSVCKKARYLLFNETFNFHL